MAADKIQENGNGNKNQNKTLEAVFKEAHDYLENLEKNIAKLLKKFHLNNGSFDGDIDKKTTANNIEEVYQEKILKLKDDLIHNKKTLNKQALVSSLISMSMQAQGQALGEISQLAKKELKGKDLAEFEKEKINLIKDINTNEFQELRKDLVDASKNLGNMGEVVVSHKEVSARDGLKQQSISLLEKRLRKQIGQKEFENGMAKIMNEADKFNIETEIAQALGNKIKEIDLSQAKKAGERSMTSGVLPLAMIMTPGLKRVIPILPAVIGVGIWARLMHGSAMDKTMAVGETALYIAPITGTAMSGRDTYIAWEKYQKGEAEMGDVVANGVGTVVSAGFDVATVFLAVTGVGAPAAVGSNALRISAKESAKLGIKKIASIFTKEAVEKGTTDGFVLTLKEFSKGKFAFIKTAHSELGTIGIIKKGSQQALKETGEGLWSIVTFKPLREMDNIVSKAINSPFRGVDKLIAKPKLAVFEKLESKGIIKSGASERLKQNQAAIALREVNHETRTEQDANTIDVEDTIYKYVENISSKNLDPIINNTKEIIENHGNSEKLKGIMEAVKAQDEHMGDSMNISYKLLSTVKEYNEIRLKSDGSIDINSMRKIASLEEMLKSSEGKISKGFYEYLERTIGKMKAGEDFSEGSANFMLIRNKIAGNRINSDFQSNKQIEEYYELFKNGEKESINGYAGNYFKLIDEMNNVNFSKLKGERAEIFIENYLEILKKSEHSGNGVIRVEQLKGKELGTQTGYENMIENLLNNPKTSHIRDIIIKHTDLSLITRSDLKERIVIEGLNHLKKMPLKDTINQLKHLSYYDDYKSILKEKMKPSIIEGVVGEVGTKNVDYYGIIKILARETKSNRDLLVLLDFARDNKTFGIISQKRGVSDKDYIENRIFENILNNDQINPHIGSKEHNTITREELDNLFRDVSKMGDERLKEVMGIIEYKFKTDISTLLESHDVIARLFKLNPPRFEELVIKELSGDHTSIEFKIKLLDEIEKQGVVFKGYDILSKALLNEKNAEFIQKIDYIEYFYKNNDYYKIHPNTEIESRIKSLKLSDEYKNLNKKIDEKLVMLLDTDRAFSDRFIKDLKNSGEISHHTLKEIDKAIINGSIKYNNGIILKELDINDILKLKKVREQVEKALNNYEFNLFDAGLFKNKNDTEKVNYIFDIIDQTSGWKLSRGAESSKEINRTIVKQLNVLKNNFDIPAETIDKFLYEILRKKDISGFNIESKIHLLKTLEKTGIIKPSIEQKLEYIIAIDAKTDDMRKNISHIKSYSKDFESTLSPVNETIRNLKTEISKGTKTELNMIDEVKKTINERVPVEATYLDGKDLRSGIDYVKIDGKIYITEVFPSRYFISQMIATKDIRQKESYMELIHNKKDFGDRTIKEYFKDPNIDIETKILLTYHDDLKYDIETITFLKEISKTHPKEVAYALSKRKDFDIISGKGDKINEQMLDTMLTKNYLEEKLGKNIDENQYIIYKDGIKKMLLFIDNPEFKALATSVRSYDDLDETKLGKIASDLKSMGIMLDESLLASKEFLTLVIGVRSSDVSIADDLSKRSAGIKSLLESKEISNIITGVRGSMSYERDKVGENGKTGIDNMFDIHFIKDRISWENYGVLIRWLMEEFRKDREESGAKLKDSGTGVLDSMIEFGKEKFTLRNILGLLIIKGIMTPEEAQAAADNMTKAFEQDPRYKDYEAALKANKSAEALEIKKQILNDVTKATLGQFLSELSNRSREGVRKKIDAYPLQIKTILSDLYLKSDKVLDPKDQKVPFNSSMVLFIDAVHNGGGNAEYLANNMKTDFKYNDGGKFINELVQVGKNADTVARYRKDTAKLQESTAKLQESTAKLQESTKARNEILKKLEELRK